jgi:hypothetical protein
MNLSKLAAVALACLAIGAIGASGASAKVCSTEGTGAACGTGHGNVYTGPIDFSTSSVSLTSGFSTITCSESEGKGEITSGESGAGTITSLTFGGCKDNLGNTCTATSSANKAAPWEFTTTLGANTNGLIHIKKSTTEWSCVVYVCKYTTGEFTGLVEGGETAMIAFNKVAETKETGSSSLCSATATISGSFKITTPDSLFIT